MNETSVKTTECSVNFTGRQVTINSVSVISHNYLNGEINHSLQAFVNLSESQIKEECSKAIRDKYPNDEIHEILIYNTNVSVTKV